MTDRFACALAFSLCLVWNDLHAADAAPAGAAPVPLAAVEQMPRLPEPLAVRDWAAVARSYYNRVLDPRAAGDGFGFVCTTPHFVHFRSNRRPVR